MLKKILKGTKVRNLNYIFIISILTVVIAFIAGAFQYLYVYNQYKLALKQTYQNFTDANLGNLNEDLENLYTRTRDLSIKIGFDKDTYNLFIDKFLEYNDSISNVLSNIRKEKLFYPYIRSIMIYNNKSQMITSDTGAYRLLNEENSQYTNTFSQDLITYLKNCPVHTKPTFHTVVTTMPNKLKMLTFVYFLYANSKNCVVINIEYSKLAEIVSKNTLKDIQQILILDYNNSSTLIYSNFTSKDTEKEYQKFLNSILLPKQQSIISNYDKINSREYASSIKYSTNTNVGIGIFTDLKKISSKTIKYDIIKYFKTTFSVITVTFIFFLLLFLITGNLIFNMKSTLKSTEDKLKESETSRTEDYVKKILMSNNIISEKLIRSLLHDHNYVVDFNSPIQLALMKFINPLISDETDNLTKEIMLSYYSKNVCNVLPKSMLIQTQFNKFALLCNADQNDFSVCISDLQKIVNLDENKVCMAAIYEISYAQLSICYYELEEIINYSFYTEANEIITKDLITSRVNSNFDLLSSITKIRAICLKIENQTFTTLKRDFHTFIDDISYSEFQSLSFVMQSLLYNVCKSISTLRSKISLNSNFDFNLLSKTLAAQTHISGVYELFEILSDEIIDLDNIQPIQKTNETIASVIKIVSNAFSDPNICLQSIADSLQLNANYLGKLFKKVMLVSLANYILNCKLSHARQLLTSTNMSIKAIAEKVGILNYSYFCAVFKKNFYVSPKEYRDISKKSV